MMKISVVICTRNRPDSLRKCLTSIFAGECSIIKEIIIVDQSDHKFEYLNTFEDKEELLSYFWGPDRGLSKARNKGISKAIGDIIAFTDDDCRVSSDWAVKIVDTFEKNNEVSGICGRVLAGGDISNITYHYFKTYFGEITYASKPGPLFCSALIDKLQVARYNQPVMTVEHFGSGNNMAFRRNIFDEFGNFIEILGAGAWLRSGEDTEFQYRLLRKNLFLQYTPSVLVFHDRWISSEESAELENSSTVGIIAVYFYFCLCGDRYAWNYFRHRFDTVKQEVLSVSSSPTIRKPLNFYIRRAKAFAQGFLGGAWLATFYRNQ